MSCDDGLLWISDSHKIFLFCFWGYIIQAFSKHVTIIPPWQPNKMSDNKTKWKLFFAESSFDDGRKFQFSWQSCLLRRLLWKVMNKLSIILYKMSYSHVFLLPKIRQTKTLMRHSQCLHFYLYSSKQNTHHY